MSTEGLKLLEKLTKASCLQVWNACKPGTDDSDQPIHEMDVLSGHENDVNYVQFRLVYSQSEVLKDSTLPMTC